MSDTTSNNAYIELTTEIVSAYVSNNSLPTAELPALIEAIHGSLSKIASGVQEAPVETLTPAVPLKKSITPDFIICLEDGKKFKSLKRHLRTKYDMTPDQYRAKWGLPSDYPHGCAELRLGSLGAREGHGPRCAAPQARRSAGPGDPRPQAAQGRLNENCNQGPICLRLEDDIGGLAGAASDAATLADLM